MHLVTVDCKERMTSSRTVNCALTAHSFSSFKGTYIYRQKLNKNRLVVGAVKAGVCSKQTSLYDLTSIHVCWDAVIVQVGIMMHIFRQSILKVKSCLFSCLSTPDQSLREVGGLVGLSVGAKRCRNYPPKYDVVKVWWEGVLHAVLTNTLV